MKLLFITDPGHGWLEVPMSLIRDMGIAGSISRYSYRFGDMAYLEEDCDASMFMRFAEHTGYKIEVEHLEQDPTPIRNYQRFAA